MSEQTCVNINNATNVAHIDNVKNIAHAEQITNIANVEHIGTNIENVLYDPARYKGVNLAEKGYTWKSIKEKVNAGDLNDFQVGDYMPVRVKWSNVFNGDNPISAEYTIIMQIAGIDTHYGIGPGVEVDGQYVHQATGHHIDWVSKDCFSGEKKLTIPAESIGLDITGFNVKYRNEASNNGDSTEPCPYLHSNYYHLFNNTDFPTWFENGTLVDLLSDKIVLLESRYSSGWSGGDGTMYFSTKPEWKNLGKFWLLTEYEVFGACLRGDDEAAGNAIQYPLFANDPSAKIKRRRKDVFNTEDIEAATWALATCDADHRQLANNESTNVNAARLVLAVGGGGQIGTVTVNTDTYFAFGFRIAEDNYGKLDSMPPVISSSYN